MVYIFTHNLFLKLSDQYKYRVILLSNLICFIKEEFLISLLYMGFIPMDGYGNVYFYCNIYTLKNFLKAYVPHL